MKAWQLLLLLPLCSKTSAFLTQSTKRGVVSRPPSAVSSLHTKKRETRSLPNAPALQASTISGGDIIDTQHENDIIKSSIYVGAITALMGFIYGKVLGVSVNMVWTILPNLIIQRLGCSAI